MASLLLNCLFLSGVGIRSSPAQPGGWFHILPFTVATSVLHVQIFPAVQQLELFPQIILKEMLVRRRCSFLWKSGTD